MEFVSSLIKTTNGSSAPVGTAAEVPPASMPVVPRPSIDPHALAHMQLPKPTLAVVGAEVLDGNVAVQNLTRELVAKAVGVSTTYLDAARRLSPKARQDVVRGLRPLVTRKATTAPTPVLSVDQRLSAIVGELGIGGVISVLNKLNKQVTA